MPSSSPAAATAVLVSGATLCLSLSLPFPLHSIQLLPPHFLPVPCGNTRTRSVCLLTENVSTGDKNNSSFIFFSLKKPALDTVAFPGLHVPTTLKGHQSWGLTSTHAGYSL